MGENVSKKEGLLKEETDLNGEAGLREEAGLKKQLLEIKESEYQHPSTVSLNEITRGMLKHIGSTDPVLRDELIYKTFYYWIIKKKYYSAEELLGMLQTALDEQHLFYKLGNSGDDSVFTRSFSALLAALLTGRHRMDGIFPEGEVRLLKEKALDYFSRERDHRGYVESKGWAHSAAHGADLLDELVRCVELGRDDLLRILDALRAKVLTGDYVFINEEDERMVTAIIGITERRLLKQGELNEWAAAFRRLERPAEYHHYHYLLTNVKNLLRSLYFRILQEQELKDLAVEIRETLDKISNFR